MERQFTEQEVQDIYRAEPELRKLGLIIQETDADSAEDVRHNTELIFAWFNRNPATPLTVRSMVQTAEKLRNKLRWMSAAQLRYIKVYEEGLSRSQKDAFGQFWNMASTKRSLVQNGDAGFENCVALIEWARGKDFSIQTFNTALGNLAAQGKLHLSPVHQPQRTGHEADGKAFMSREDTNVSILERARRDRERNSQNRPSETSAETPDAWKTLAEKLRGATHGEDAALKSIVGDSWRETYTLRKKYLARREGSQFNRTAV